MHKACIFHAYVSRPKPRGDGASRARKASASSSAVIFGTGRGVMGDPHSGRAALEVRDFCPEVVDLVSHGGDRRGEIEGLSHAGDVGSYRIDVGAHVGQIVLNVQESGVRLVLRPVEERVQVADVIDRPVDATVGVGAVGANEIGEFFQRHARKNNTLHLCQQGRDRCAEGWWRHVGCPQPCEPGLVGAVRDWPLSSFHRDVGRGLAPEDWTGEVGRFGE